MYAELRTSSPALEVLSGCLWSPALAGLPEGWVETVAAVFVLVATEVSKRRSMCCMPERDVSIASSALTACPVTCQARCLAGPGKLTDKAFAHCFAVGVLHLPDAPWGIGISHEALRQPGGHRMSAVLIPGRSACLRSECVVCLCRSGHRLKLSGAMGSGWLPCTSSWRRTRQLNSETACWLF